jgi:hypothetical protein
MATTRKNNKMKAKHKKGSVAVRTKLDNILLGPNTDQPDCLLQLRTWKHQNVK